MPLVRAERRGLVPPLVRDIRDGRAGWPALIGVALAAAAALISIMLVLFGVVEANGGRVDDAAYALGFALIGAVWCPVVAWLLTRRGRGQRWVKAIAGVIGVWVIATPLIAFLEMAIRRSDLLMIACLFAGICASILIISNALHGGGGRPLEDVEGRIHVTCPSCGYSMVGLASCQCPECGAAFTIDQLIRSQDYAALRTLGTEQSAVRGEPAVLGQPELPAPLET
jgi:hypothetical protein